MGIQGLAPPEVLGSWAAAAPSSVARSGGGQDTPAPPTASRSTTCHRRLRQPEHKVLGQLRNCKSDVFVVTEVLQTQEEVTVSQTQKHEGSGQFALLGALSFQVCGESWELGRGRGGQRGVPRQNPPHQQPASSAHDLEPRPEPLSAPQGQGQGRRSRKKKVSIPAGTVLAFQVAQLLVDPDWGELGLGCLLRPWQRGEEAQLPGRPRSQGRAWEGAG